MILFSFQTHFSKDPGKYLIQCCEFLLVVLNASIKDVSVLVLFSFDGF